MYGDYGQIVLSDDYSFPIIPGQNRNVLVVGGSGCGKSMSVIEPSILANKGSMIIVDPKGYLYRKYAGGLKERGFEVHMIDLVDPSRSDIGFNPLIELSLDTEILSLANMIVYSDHVNNAGFDPYWNMQSAELLSIIISLAVNVEKQRHGKADMTYINEYLGEIHNDESSSEFEAKIHSVPADTLTCKLYRRFSHIFSSERTMACIYSSLEAVVGKWSCRETEEFFRKENYDIERLADTQGAVFVKISDSDDTNYPLATIILRYWMDRLFRYADLQDNGMCRKAVQIIFDDYSSNIVIGGFQRYISTCRARNIGMTVVIQSLSQISSIHSDDAKTICNNCGHIVFFGTSDLDTAKELSQRLSISLGEALAFPLNKVAVFRRGYKPLVADRYNIEKLKI